MQAIAAVIDVSLHIPRFSVEGRGGWLQGFASLAIITVSITIKD